MNLNERKYDRVVYHAGDFSRKAEDIRQLNNGRSTGFFGTGHYFTTSPEKCARQGTGNRPIYAIDISNYDLRLGTLSLHKALKSLNMYVSCYPLIEVDSDDWHGVIYHAGQIRNYGKSIASSLEESFEVFGESSFVDYANVDRYIRAFLGACKKFERLREFVGLLSIDHPDWAAVQKAEDREPMFNPDVYDRVFSLKAGFPMYAIDLGCSESQLRTVCEDVYGLLKRYYVGNRNLSPDLIKDPLDSIPTMIMKALGYEGIYPDVDTDNISYGGVIYDLDLADVVLFRPGFQAARA